MRVYHIWQLRISAQRTDSFIAVLTDRMLYEWLHPFCCWTKPFSEQLCLQEKGMAIPLNSAEVTAGGTVRSGRDLAGEELLCVCRKLLT